MGEDLIRYMGLYKDNNKCHKLSITFVLNYNIKYIVVLVFIN